MTDPAELLPVAHQIARREVAKHRINYDDVLSDALYGLAKAVARCTDDSTFRAYARATMEGEVMHGKRDRVGRYSKTPRPALVPLDKLDDDLDEPKAMTVADPSAINPADAAVHAEMWELVDRLDARARLVVRLYYQANVSQAQIAPLIGCSQMHVCRILRAAIAQLRDALTGAPLPG